MNPLDALLVPPAMLKRALEDLHDIAQIARRVADMEDELRARVDAAEEDLQLLNLQLGGQIMSPDDLRGFYLFAKTL